MKTQKVIQNELENTQISVQLKLAALWISFMFLYIYVDYFHLYMPNTINDIQRGKVFVFDITEGFLLATLGFATIPILMIFLSVVLPAKANRLTNIIVGIILIPYMLFNLIGETWMHMLFAAVVEVVLLGLIIWYSWKWSRIENII